MADFRRMAYTNPLRSSSPTCRARATPLLAQDVAVQRCADKPFHAQDARIEVVAVGSVSAGAGFSGGGMAVSGDIGAGAPATCGAGCANLGIHS